MESINNSKDIYDIIIENETRKWESSMMNNLQPTTWETPKYSRNQIDKAGKIIADPDSFEQDKKAALEILNNWRASHAYPLQVITNNLRRKNNDAIVVQRLKRLDSIIGKLKRNPNMNLYGMQDLGGCRVIVDSIQDVYNAIFQYKNSRIRHILKSEDDYIQEPKTSGYRSYHLIYQFQSDNSNTYNQKMLIEIQFRTRLQHIWATAVEMMGIYTKSNLKSSQGDKDILRFFTLVSSLFAIMEDMPVCPNTSDWADELISEIMHLDQNSNIIMKLQAINQAVQTTEYNENFYLTSGYYLLVLDYDEPSLNIYPFKRSNFELAVNAYNKMESEFLGKIDTVLVSVKSFDTLKTAYPNYFIDISEFLDILRTMMINYSRYNENARKLLESNFYILKDRIPMG